MGMMADNNNNKSIVGDLINFRGLVYSPVNESGVVFLFGKVVEDLNMYIEEIKPGYPDCIARRFVGNGWERVAIEFELNARNFVQHKHDPKGCDIIVCWENDWQDIPKEYNIEIIELKPLIRQLPNREIKRPVKGTHDPEQDNKEKIFLNRGHEVARRLFHKADDIILGINDQIWHNFGERLTSYYSPKRVFTYLKMQKTSLRVYLFTAGTEFKGVSNKQPKWGMFTIKTEKDFEPAIKHWKKSLEMINEAIKNNEPTGWYAEIAEAADEEDEEQATM
jgi:hypothetical protein